MPPAVTLTLNFYLPRTSTVTLGPRAFYSSGPACWNSLPTELRHP